LVAGTGKTVTKKEVGWRKRRNLGRGRILGGAQSKEEKK